MKYRHNHYVPSCIIKSWCTEGPKYKGVHVYEISKHKKIFSCCEGQRKFSFAIDDNIYIPEINNKRATSVERWFQTHENALSHLINGFNNHRSGNFEIDLNNLTLIKMAIIGLEQRTKYVLEKTRKEILSRNSLKDNCDIKKTKLENMINGITEMTKRIVPAHVIVTRLNDKELLLSDRPVVDGDDMKITAIGRKIMIVIIKDSFSRITYKNEDPDFIDIINKHIIKNAREWLVAGSEQLLDKYIPFFSTDEYKQDLQNERIIDLKLDHIEFGCSIEK